MLAPAIAFGWFLVSPAIEGFFPEPPFVDMRSDTARIAGSQEEDLESKYAPMKRVLIRGAIDPDVIELAKTMLTLPMGMERVAIVNGKPYSFRLEPHYHPPGFEHAPTGWHKGVTVYDLVENTGERAARE